MSNAYQRNHYVPEWYQKRFLLDSASKFYYLDLRPAKVRSSGGRLYTRRDLLRWGPKKCFVKDDLYTTEWGGLKNRDIEKFFFGQHDTTAPEAVSFFANYSFANGAHDAFNALLPYMSVQKLRTPKGLAWLQAASRSITKNQTLQVLQQIQNIFCAIWTECVWQIADASESPTKFIISDHPVVVYNRDCFPASKWCNGVNDPDIRMVGTHTYFPLSIDKILILTNLSWVRDPFQNALNVRPNPDFFRGAMFNFLDIQVERTLTEEEVIEINYITKRRAFRYIASAKREWLYPERNLRSTHWRKLGDGYLLMPDPRHIHGGGEIVVGYEDGRSDMYGEYGHRPWQPGFKDEARSEHEWETMTKFKAEWAANYGPDYRGIVSRSPSPSGASYSMGDEYHQRECERDNEYLKFPGERARRRKLKRSKKQ